MTKTTNKASMPHDNFDVPMYFSDQPASLTIGALVSRITFGVAEDDDSEFPRPVVTVAMPTVDLMKLMHDLKKTFDDPKFKKYTLAGLKKAAEYFASEGEGTPDNQMIKSGPLVGKRSLPNPNK